MKDCNAACESKFFGPEDEQAIEARLNAVEVAVTSQQPPPPPHPTELLRRRPRIDRDVLAASERYAVLIGDVHMPDIQVVLTGNGSSERARNAMRRGYVFRLLEKPCPCELLRGASDDTVAEVRKREAQEAQLTTLEGRPEHAEGAASIGELTGHFGHEVATLVGLSPAYAVDSLPSIGTEIGSPVDCLCELGDTTLEHVGATERANALVAGAQITPSLRLVRELAVGGMGSVWIAEHLSLRTRVAVKFLSSHFAGLPEHVARFAAEASATTRIRSPHVAQILDHGFSGGRPYIVMELLEGEDLARRLARDGRIPPDETATIVYQLCKALEQAHALGIVHRDIKPANVFLVSGMGETFVKLLDFGLAKDGEGPSRITGSDAVFGTPHYLSPEQAESARRATSQSDLWSLAVVVYECLSGERPFEGATLMGLCIALQSGRFTPLTWIRPELPPALDAWFARALRYEPTERFASAAAFSRALTEALGATPARETTLVSRSHPRLSCARRRAAWGVGGVAIAASVALFATPYVRSGSGAGASEGACSARSEVASLITPAKSQLSAQSTVECAPASEAAVAPLPVHPLAAARHSPSATRSLPIAAPSPRTPASPPPPNHDLSSNPDEP